MRLKPKFRNCPMRHRSQWQTLILALPLLVSGMTVGCARRTIVKVDHCTGWAPILVAPADVLTDGTARMILAHDLYGARMGCWPTPAKTKATPTR